MMKKSIRNILILILLIGVSFLFVKFKEPKNKKETVHVENTKVEYKIPEKTEPVNNETETTETIVTAQADENQTAEEYEALKYDTYEHAESMKVFLEKEGLSFSLKERNSDKGYVLYFNYNNEEEKNNKIKEIESLSGLTIENIL